MNKLSFPIILLSMIASLEASAYDAKIDGIYYNFTEGEAEVTFQKQNDAYPVFVSDYVGKIVIPEYVTHDGQTYPVTRIGNFAFYNCTGITSVTLSGNITIIGGEAFYNCSGLTTLTIPESVTDIENNAFDNCTGLTAVSIPESITRINESTFAYCSKLTAVTIPESVTRIDDNAFFDCSKLATLTIPENVISIGENAFSSTAWYNKQPTGMVYAGKVAYRYKGTMPAGTHLTIEEGTIGIADAALADCSRLTDITLPGSLTHIGKKAFRNCTGLTAIAIPESVTHMGGGAFENCTDLTQVVVPNIEAWCGITFEDYIANPLYFAQHIYDENNTEITDLFIPAGVTSISKAAFCNCRNLVTITIPRSMTDIDDLAFYGCKSLTDIFFVAKNLPHTSLSAFQGLRIAGVTLYVPKSTVELFRTTQPWSSFGRIHILSELKGDINGDNRVDISDAVTVLNIIAAGRYNIAADLNEDHTIDVADFVTVLNIIAAQ